MKKQEDSESNKYHPENLGNQVNSAKKHQHSRMNHNVAFPRCKVHIDTTAYIKSLYTCKNRHTHERYIQKGKPLNFQLRDSGLSLNIAEVIVETTI